MNAIPPHPVAHVALVGDDLVLLDAAKDAYYCLPSAAGAWRALRDGAATDAADALARLLAASGYLGQAGPCETRRPLPQAGLAHDAAPAIRAADIWRLLRAWWDYLRHYEGRGFAHLLRAATRDRPTDPVARADCLRAAQVFSRLIVWLPVSGKCLVRSFLLLRFLHHSGATAAWVFGVAVWPFKAHCWLEADGVALDDAPERLAGYTPILAA